MPQLMKAILLRSFGQPDGLGLTELAVPEPGPGEVLIKMAASPINPSDLILLSGANPHKRTLPCVPGFEGAGKVIASGGGEAADNLVGQNVACRAKPIGDGAWAEFMVTEAQRCIPLLPHVSLLDASMLLVNPLTAWALIDSAIGAGHKAAIQTAAASALGKMVVKMAQDRQWPLINVVRRETQVKLLKDLGATWVLNSEAPDFAHDLQKAALELGATVCFEAIAGTMVDKILRLMPSGSELWSYGGLSGENCSIDPMVLVYGEKTIRGFWGPPTLYKNPAKLQAAVSEIQAKITTVFQTEVRSKFALQDHEKALKLYSESMGAGKMIFVMD
jgi:NADPH2:quinone reductase